MTLTTTEIETATQVWNNHSNFHKRFDYDLEVFLRHIADYIKPTFAHTLDREPDVSDQEAKDE